MKPAEDRSTTPPWEAPPSPLPLGLGDSFQPSVVAAGSDPARSELEMLSTELLNNSQCRELIPHLNDFENEVFGPDFACDAVHLRPWADSQCLLYSAVTGEVVAGQRRILSVLSLFVTTAAERDRMLLGHIADYEMTPWADAGLRDQPAVYLSSVVGLAPSHLTAMYRSLLHDAARFRDKHGLAFHGGFAIAAAPKGRRHLARSGFRLLDGYSYRGVYDLMIIDASTSTSPFWSGLLCDGTVFLRRADSSQAVNASLLGP